MLTLLGECSESLAVRVPAGVMADLEACTADSLVLEFLARHCVHGRLQAAHQQDQAGSCLSGNMLGYIWPS